MYTESRHGVAIPLLLITGGAALDKPQLVVREFSGTVCFRECKHILSYV